ncbi:hypothetical protein [Lysinibacillus sp. ACHW1.5]|uniref:hypothetical protein n=1 Tax=Lysinibacillus sp. ACHW1.5 TaxID=2913506 RepID=UPI001EDC73B7|nr:hypothetical protein [Lysinibacillus sp. ACHW1.5]UKJ44684.1 hypothetical protein L6W14_18470 [Lysinibacillus sp. ACHW1.5]
MSKTNHINKSRIIPALPYALNNLNSKLKIKKPKYSMSTSFKKFQQSNVQSNNNKKAIIDSEIKTSLKNDNQKHLSITAYDLAKDLLKKNELVIIEDILYYWDTLQRKYVDLNQANAINLLDKKSKINTNIKSIVIL